MVSTARFQPRPSVSTGNTHPIPQSTQRVRASAILPKLRLSDAVIARAPCARAIRSNSPAVKSPRLSGRIITVLRRGLARSVREIEGDVGSVVFLEVAQGMAEDLSMS